MLINLPSKDKELNTINNESVGISYSSVLRTGSINFNINYTLSILNKYFITFYYWGRY